MTFWCATLGGSNVRRAVQVLLGRVADALEVVGDAQVPR
ncbi:hypothetical protein SEA_PHRAPPUCCINO_168 [Mycobacterium phage Phrappuccino]|uniref:Uncharacterized protein n=1 Tax=Mycobacterium phage Phrappuccino TaxID=2591223 RepID=A0A514DDZ5_9CAUD|nr:hypothetical protein KHQ87_gp168 [Mycobacterium phage Phrappuccino]QDH91843.1 hypothetical protein SEA_PHRAPPUCCINO_168 [Mycobacterium phage Phrappuccino]QIQ63285.1 hypothetical protein SEA_SETTECANDELA_168 [Mycobacterium phage Settecandela]